MKIVVTSQMPSEGFRDPQGSMGHTLRTSDLNPHHVVTVSMNCWKSIVLELGAQANSSLNSCTYFCPSTSIHYSQSPALCMTWPHQTPPRPSKPSTRACSLEAFWTPIDKIRAPPLRALTHFIPHSATALTMLNRNVCLRVCLSDLDHEIVFLKFEFSKMRVGGRWGCQLIHLQISNRLTHFQSPASSGFWLRPPWGYMNSLHIIVSRSGLFHLPCYSASVVSVSVGDPGHSNHTAL